jgi:DNA-binding transcriptional regulator YdaS (Cro superfamily)
LWCHDKMIELDFLQIAKEKIGGPTNLARALGIRSQAVSQWRRVPALRVLQVENVTGISRCDLRPDLYPRGAKMLNHQRERACQNLQRDITGP